VKRWIRHCLEALGLIFPAAVVARISPDYPDETLAPGVLHVVGGKNYQKWAYLKCPCGCGAQIMLSLSTTKRPNWTVTFDWLGRPTIRPSIWQSDGCFSHFWVREGRIEWTKDTGKPHPDSRLARD
jgi:hypothetical protein